MPDNTHLTSIPVDQPGAPLPPPMPRPPQAQPTAPVTPPTPPTLAPPSTPPSPAPAPAPAPTPTPATPSAPVANQAPIFQASPSGGVVATLRPGQTNFEGEIRAESDRRSGFVKHTADGPSTSNNATIEVQMPDSQKSTAGGLKLNDLRDARLHDQLEVELRRTEGGSQDGKVVASQATDISAIVSDVAGDTSQATAPNSVRNFRVGAAKSDKRRINWGVPVLVGGLAAIGIGIFAFYFSQRKASAPPPTPTVAETTILDYWGLWEPSSTLTQVFKDFEDENPGVSVNYTKQPIKGYRESLQAALVSDNGPDVFRYHASWRPFLDDQLSVMPASIMNEDEYEQIFYPVASEQLIDDEGGIKGVPLMYDGLALLYNKDIFLEAGVEVPTTWAQFGQTAVALTKYDSDGNMSRAGAAFGLWNNVDFASDIIGLLALQNGFDIDEPDGEVLIDAIKSYTQFYTDPTRRVWDTDFDNSTLAFARGDVAMIFAPSWLIHDILAIDQRLNIGVASVPQIDPAHPVEWATYYAEGVSANSSSKLAAWRLLEYMSRPEVAEKLNNAQGKLRNFGEVYARRDMADQLASNAYAQPYLVGAVYARNLPFNDRTYDEALNDSTRALLANLIQDVISGRDTSRNLEGFMTQLVENLGKYNYYPPIVDDEL